MESDSTRPGTSLAPILPSPIGLLGLQICYDLRFAELSIHQRRQGAQILTFPSAFTVKTGMAHWGKFAHIHTHANVPLIHIL